MDAEMQSDAQQLYIFDPTCLSIIERAHLTEAVNQTGGTAFAGMADPENQGQQEQGYQDENDPDYDSELHSHWR